MRRSHLLPLACLLAACGGDRDPPPDTLPDGAPIVVSELADSADAAWSAELVGTLGSVDGDGPDVFGQIGGLELDSRGNVYVLDYQGQDVRVFDAGGDFVRTIGRKGEGPGEFRGAAGLNLDASERLWVWDYGNRRFSIFSDSGYVSSIPRFTSGVIFPWRGELDGAGRMIDWGLDYPERQMNDPGSLAIFYPIRVWEDGSQDTLPPLRYDIQRGSSGAVPMQGRLSVYLDEREAIWFAHEDEYRIYKRGLEGDTLLAFELTGIVPDPVTGEEIDSVLALYENYPPDMQPPTRDDFPDTEPVVRRITSDGRDRVFVFPQVAAHPAGSVVDVFTAQGRFMDRVSLPVRLALNPAPVVRNATILGVTLDEMQVPRVVTILLETDGTK